MTPKLSSRRRDVLETLNGYSLPVTARRLADRLDRPKFGARRWSYAKTFYELGRLERAGLAESTVAPLRGFKRPRRLWQTTSEGREALRPS